MTTLGVKIWNKQVGVLTWNSETCVPQFRFDADWGTHHLDISPVMCPLRQTVCHPLLVQKTSSYYCHLPYFLSDFMPCFEGRLKGANPVLLLSKAGADGLGAFDFQLLEGDDTLLNDIPMQRMRGRSRKEFVEVDGIHYIKKYGRGVRMEMAYNIMARLAKVHVPEMRLTDDFSLLIQRFDREGSQRLHTQTLAAMNHSARGYKGLMDTCRTLNLGKDAEEQVLRLMCFNHLTGNVDDNTKNVSFVMHPDSTWHLAPAYDLTFCYDPRNPHGPNSHRLKQDIPLADIPRQLFDSVCLATLQFPRICQDLNIPLSEYNDAWQHIQKQLRCNNQGTNKF